MEPISGHDLWSVPHGEGVPKSLFLWWLEEKVWWYRGAECGKAAADFSDAIEARAAQSGKGIVAGLGLLLASCRCSWRGSANNHMGPALLAQFGLS
jgi:hypothetical protein